MVRRFACPESDTQFAICLNCLMRLDERDIAERLLENGVISDAGTVEPCIVRQRAWQHKENVQYSTRRYD